MHIVKYSDIQKYIPSEQASMILRLAMYEEDDTICVDLDDDVKGFFKIEPTDEEDEFKFSEWAEVAGEKYEDVETEGEHSLEELTSLIEHRLQTFHQVF